MSIRFSLNRSISLRQGTNTRANTFGAIRSSWYCRPLAILLPLLMLGPLPEFRKFSLIPRAAAEPCLSGQTVVLQTCAIPASFETNAINAFLQAHSIPLTDAPLIPQYGRADLRNELRADLFYNLLAIIKKYSGTRTSDEQTVYNWMQNIVWQHEQQLYFAAVQDYNSWKSDPCHWTPDPNVAQQYNLNYDGSEWCAASNEFAAPFIIAPPVPSIDYFLAAALIKTYGAILGSTPGGPAVLGGMDGYDLEEAGVAAGGGLAVVGGIGAALGIIASITTGATGGFAATTGLVSTTTGAVLSGTLGAAGGAAMAVLGVIIGVVATIEVFQRQQTLNQLNTLTAQYNQLLTFEPALEDFVSDSVSLNKIRMSFAENTLPDFPSSTVPPGRLAGDRNFVITPSGGSPAVSPTFTYVDWIGTKWTAQPSGGWISAQGVTTAKTTDYNFGVSIKFKGWDGNLYIADRNDLHFIVSRPLPPSSDNPYCGPDSTGTSPGDVSSCAIYVADSLNLLDANGNKVSVRLTSFPLFTSPNTFPADVTTGATLNITADGDPLPTISSTSALPTGFSFSATAPGAAQITVAPSTSPATYTLTFQADNGGGSPATQTVTVIANIPVQIQGDANSLVQNGLYTVTSNQISYSHYAGQPFSQTIVVAGSPKPTLTCTGNSFFQSSGAVFTDNGNGTGTLSGALGPETFDVGNNPVAPIPIQCTLYASNGLTSDSKLISVNGVLPPAATITSATTVTWVDNQTNELRVTTSVPAGPLGTPSVSFSFPCGIGTTNGQPPWMTFKDNGNGTAVLTGQPPFGTTSVPLLLFVSTGEQPRCFSGITNTGNGFVNVPIPPDITINVQHVPALPNPAYQFMTAGVPIITTIGPSLPAGGNGAVSGTPPPGVQFTAGALSSWQLSGTPPAGSGGEYDMLYTATAPTSSASENFQLFVLQPPQVVSLNAVTFRTGQNNTFDVNTTGFPKLAIPGLRGPMQITLQGMLPQGVTFTNTNPEGEFTGTAVFSGNPPASARGNYPLTLTASNGVGNNATQQFTLAVGLPGDANLDGVVNCTDLNIVDASFGYYRGSPQYNPEADLNNDGVVNFADVAIVEANLPPGNSCVFTVDFGSMSAAVTTKGNSGNFSLTAAFTLNPLSTGINPVTQPFSLQLGNFNVTLPAGSFKLQQNGSWTYSGTVTAKGTVLTVQIQPTGNNSFQLTATANGGDLSKLTNSVPVSIRIGEDGGSISIAPGSN